LFVFRIGTNDAYNPVTTDDFATSANSFN